MVVMIMMVAVVMVVAVLVLVLVGVVDMAIDDACSSGSLWQ